MDSPLSEKPDQFYIVDQLLIKNGLSAPKIYSADLKKGLILMEDFGDNLYVNCIQKHPDREKSLYHQAIDTLVSLSKISCFDHIPKYDFSVCWQGISVFLDWYFGAFLGKPVSEPARTDFKAIWQNLFTRLNTAPKGLLLFDYQIYNLMDLPNRQGGQKCGILDFQDAYHGPLAYDLTSLINDARREKELSLPEREALLEYYLKKMNFSDPEKFIESYYIMAIKRTLRFIGNFHRLSIRGKKSHYLRHNPMLWRLLEEYIQKPYFKDLKGWMNKIIPVPVRE